MEHPPVNNTPPSVEKECSRCCLVKDADQFYHDKHNPDGLTSRCKDCFRETGHAFYLCARRYPPAMDGSKVCSLCMELKSVTEFNAEPLAKDGRKTQCKTCLATAQKNRRLQDPQTFNAARRETRHRLLSNPTKRAAYNARKLAYYRRIHGEYKRGQRVAIAHLPKRKLREQEKFQRASGVLRARYGNDFADAYLANPFPMFTASGRAALEQLKISVVNQLTGLQATPAMLARICSLNLIWGLPGLHIGWHCMACGIAHFDPRFFEIDHIIPRSKSGHNSAANKQCLCPSCHKKKTLGIDGISHDHNFKINQSTSHLQLRLPIS